MVFKTTLNQIHHVYKAYKLFNIAPFVYWKVVSFWKVNSEKVNYFLMFDSVMKNKFENIFQYLFIS
jgi:hypothetical protein